MSNSIYIVKEDFLNALNIDELAYFLLDIECRYIGEKTLGDFIDAIEFHFLEHDEIGYSDDIEVMAKMFDKHGVKYILK